jgi:hypothetical protein
MTKQKQTSQRGAELETRVVRIAMIEEGLSVARLAAASKMTARLLSDSLTKNFPYELTRHRVEAGFGYRRPIWMDAQNLDMRRQCVERFGFDPYLIGVRELHRRANEIGADFSLCTGKAAMIREVFARAAIPNKTKQ